MGVSNLKTKPLYKRKWNVLSPRQKLLREKSLTVLSEMRNTKSKTLRQSVNDNNISVKNIILHTNGFKKVNGKLVVKRWDRIQRVMKINTNSREKSIVIQDSRTASVVGRYHNSVKQLLNTGDKSKLTKFRNKKIKDSKGKLHRLSTDPQEIIQINERIEEIEIYEVYSR